MTPNPYQQYQTTQIKTASIGDLVVLLYDGAARFLAGAEYALDEGRLDAASADLVRAQNVILELIAGLDYEKGGDLATNLRELYLFVYQTLIAANLHKDIEQVRAAQRILEPLRAAWRAVVRGTNDTGQAPAPALAGGIAA
ncbi:MAG: flagellar export chaperone FliS [Dehalococcoidia bacterium]